MFVPELEEWGVEGEMMKGCYILVLMERVGRRLVMDCYRRAKLACDKYKGVCKVCGVHSIILKSLKVVCKKNLFRGVGVECLNESSWTFSRF